MDETLEETTVHAVAFHPHGVEMNVSFAADERKNLDRAHTFFVAYEHEEYGQDARDAFEAIRDLAWELTHNYQRQPREKETP